MSSYSERAISQALNLPNAGRGGSNYEEFSANGLRCRQSLSNDTQFDMGGLVNEQGQGAVYGRFIIPLGSRPQRLDCARFFDLEMRRQELEIELLEQQLYTLPAP